jgi:hypothetical protein
MTAGRSPGKALTGSALPPASTQGVEIKEVIVSGVDMLNTS